VAVADDAVRVVGVDGGLAERAGALVGGAACVDDPVGCGDLGSGCGDALDSHAFGFPAEDGDGLVEDFCLLAQVLLPGERFVYGAAERVEPVSFGAPQSRPGRGRR
jgi:hypothetical protein